LPVGRFWAAPHCGANESCWASRPNNVTVSGISGMTQQIHEFGQQLGKLASEVRAVREKAERVGRVIS
jgi:hypothetical protein